MAGLRTPFDKLWDAHVVKTRDHGTSLIYIDRHLVHEVSSSPAFEGVRHIDLADLKRHALDLS